MESIHKRIEHLPRDNVHLGSSPDRPARPPIWRCISLEICPGWLSSPCSLKGTAYRNLADTGAVPLIEGRIAKKYIKFGCYIFVDMFSGAVVIILNLNPDSQPV